jgi:PAS domain S-box-containing protein
MMSNTSTAAAETHDSLAHVFAGGGEMGALMRGFDWSKTAVGPVHSWPQSLKTAVRIVLTSRYAMFVWWGKELVNLYNDPYRAFLGIKHPDALGKSAREVWAEIWDQIGPRTDAVLLRAESTYDEALLLLMERHGYIEETYFTFSYSPLPDDNGAVGGIFCAVTEATQQVIGTRRMQLLRDLAAAMSGARTPQEVCRWAAQTLSSARRDLPFTLIYLLDANGTHLERSGESGIGIDHPAAPALIALDDEGNAVWPVRQVIETGEPTIFENLPSVFADLPTGDWARPPRNAVLLPIAQPGQSRPAGVLIAGLNPHREFTQDFRGFVSLLANQVAGAISNALAYETERKRAESLAELDRAKTLFFSNVSHEFRTPLTLLLGPLEDLLPQARERLTLEQQEQLATARRNALRLLKLVNSLLDFSRIEAGRVQALYRPADLSQITAELASMFRAAIEKAGLKLVVDCAPLPESVYVDRDMWEKIVLNLLSNAFKFTFEGQIEVALKAVGSGVELSVTDTGTGIPESELPRLFERFHRIEGARGRTHEGTGIGLALVQELVKLHGGSVRVGSRVNRGSTFTIFIPFGRAHLPEDRIDNNRPLPSTAVRSETYVEEAQQWFGDDVGAYAGMSLPERPAPSASEAAKDLIVLADDNADMRRYVARLLGHRYRVHAVSDGLEALDAARSLHPKLILSDVMMPRLDGFGLLKEIRSDAQLADIPVILLSARAGEESRVEGLTAGGDDYLVKPFTARELLARVETHLRMADTRRDVEKQLRAALVTSQRLAAIVESSDDAIASKDLNGIITSWNKSAERMFGYKAEEIVGKPVTTIIPPELHDDEPRILASIRAGKRIEHVQTVRVHKDGHRLNVSLTVSPVRDDAGNIIGAAKIVRDITREKTLEEASLRLAAIVESSDDAIVSKDLNGIVTSWNQSAERLFGYKAQEMIGRSILTVIPPELHPDEDMILAKIRSGQRIEHFETVRLTKSGARVDVSLSISPLRDGQGRVIGAAKIARNITERKKVEKTLRVAEKLAAAGRFAATVAHEVNNPLEAVMNLVYLAQLHVHDTAALTGFLESAGRELERVAHITRQTLGFYRDTSSPARFNVPETLDDLLSLYERRIQNRNIQIVKQYDPEAEIIALSGEVRQALSNVLTNALDAMFFGGTLIIRVRRAHRWRTSNVPGVRVSILDTGTGIRTEHLKDLFQPFFTTKSDVGTGLGLWITRGIVEKHRGIIQVKTKATEHEHGTVFSIFLPVEQGDQVTEPGEQRPARAIQSRLAS